MPRSLTAPRVGGGEAWFAAELKVALRRSLRMLLADVAPDAHSRPLQLVRNAVLTGRLDGALRQVDRAWRCHPENAAVLAPVYGRLLLMEGSDDAAALNLLKRPDAANRAADKAALISLALMRLHRPADARLEMEAALANHCAMPRGLLSYAAGALMQHPAIAVPGWMGRGPRLEFVGQLRSADTALDVKLDGGAAFAQLLRSTSAGAGTFSFCLSRTQTGATAELSSHGMALLGSGARLPAGFSLDGRIRCERRRLIVWASLGWCPTRPLKLRFEDEHHARAHTRRRPPSGAASRGMFAVDLRSTRLRGSRIHVCAQLPDGRWQPLPDSPLLLESAVRPPTNRSRRPSDRAAGPARPRRRGTLERAPAIDVIVPIHGCRQAALACIDTVLATTDSATALVLVDDASDDPALIAALDRYAAIHSRVTLLRHVTNLGFSASVNRGLTLHPTHDAVVLNSDTRVFADWLVRLREAAYSDRTVGTVTPLSNSGSIASYPGRHDSAIDPADGAALHALAASTHPGVRAEIPVGVGFCLYMRRDCLRAVGELDAAVFGAGYGEETDFCMRARAHGWTHRLAADVFVYHAGNLSFGTRREALLERSARLVNLRHPGYDRFIAEFLGRDPLRGLRRRLDERRLMGFDGRFVLLASLALTGGVERFVAERCRKLRERGLCPLVLRPAEAGDASRCELSGDGIDVFNLRYEIPSELPELAALLRALPLHAVEIQHFLHLDARLIDMLRKLPVPYEVYVHDYAWICPRVTLIDERGRYCGEPSLPVCESCVQKNGSALGESISVAALRARSAAWLRGAHRVLAPSADTAARMERRFAGLTVAVAPHAPLAAAAPGAPGAPAARAARADPTRQSTRVALIGAIGEHKGYRVLLDCARDAQARSLDLEFVVIGHTENDQPLLDTARVFVTGRYAEGEPPHLLRRENPDIVWLPSVWPETWCYTLDYALASGLPVAAFDLGAIAERLRETDRGELMPLDLEAPEINDRLLRLSATTRTASLTASRSDQTSLVPSGDDDIMTAAQSTAVLMTNSADVKPEKVVPPIVQDEGLAASVQILPVPAGLYLFSVKPGLPAPTSGGGRLRLPAMHVGVGPGVAADQVEFMAGSSTHGAWLAAPSDLLVVKVNGQGATLILNSVRAPEGAALSIKVERLSGRVEVSSSPAPVATAGGQVRATFAGGDPELPLAVHIGAHIRSRGDMDFTGVPWAGRVAPGLWIESFAVRPLERFEAGDLEYKGLTGSGFETPWLTDGVACGTQGMGVPLVGFALRFKAPAAEGYDCEYSGYFQSGLTVGPLLNGSPCRSTVASDPLEGIQVRLIQRTPSAPAAPAALETAATPAAAAPPAQDAAAPPAQDASAPRPRPGPRRSARGP